MDVSAASGLTAMPLRMLRAKRCHLQEKEAWAELSDLRWCFPRCPIAEQFAAEFFGALG